MTISMPRVRYALLLGLATSALLAACGDTGPKVDQAAVDRGRKLFATCSACHAAGADNLVGPGLGGVVGRKAGNVPGFAYSEALQAANFAWTEDRLVAFLSQEDYLPGTNMVITPLSEADARDVAAYLATLK